MTLAAAIHIGEARRSLIALFDVHLPDWENPERRLDFIDRIEETGNHLDQALYASTTPQALRNG